MFIVDRFDITPGWSNRTLLINNLNKHHEVSEKPKILQKYSVNRLPPNLLRMPV